jgi:hypothetical protein
MEKVLKARENKRTVSSPEIDGDLAARVFPYFQKKTPLTKVVMELKLKPETVQRLYRSYMVLNRIDVEQQPIVKAQIDDLRRRIDYISSNVRWKTGSAFAGLYESFKCSGCGSTHQVAVNIKCTNCQNETWIGWWPKNNRSTPAS